METRPIKQLSTSVLLATLIALTGAADLLAEEAYSGGGRDYGIVVTEEVLAVLARERASEDSEVFGAFPPPSPLASPTNFPMLEIKIHPSEIHDFIVNINGKSYSAGARLFRVLQGSCTISVLRGGREQCRTELEVTTAGPNFVACEVR